MLGGFPVPDLPPLEGNSDADVILHAICNAISGLTGKQVLGKRADALCEQGITDSRAYLDLALQDLAQDERDFILHHLSISVEAARPKFAPLKERIISSLAGLLPLGEKAITLDATSGEGLTACGRGEGISVLCVLSASCIA